MKFNKILAMVLCVAMLLSTMSFSIFADTETSTHTRAYTSADTYWGECGGSADTSFVFKFYHDDVYMGYTSLNNVNNIIDGDVTVSWHIKLDAESNTDEYWTMEWEVAPTLSMQPNRAEHWVDGVKAAEATIEPNWSDSIFPIIAAVADENGKIVSYVNNVDAATIENAVANDGTVVLYRDINVDAGLVIPEGANVVLDLNGKSIIGKTGAIVNNGTLTINDSVGTGKVYTTDVAAQGRAAVVNNGTIEINGGWFGDSNNDTSDRNAINRGNAIKNYGTAEINDGYFTNVSNQYIDYNAYAYAINTLAGATTTINDATVYGDINGLIYSDGKTIVNDGSYTLGRPNEENNLWYLAYGDVEIKGGTWTRAFAVPSWNTGNPTMNGEVVVSGGSFNVAIPDEYLAEGYEMIENADGTFGANFAVAKIGDVYYATLDDAIAAAAGEKITLLANAELNTKLNNVTINIDLNSYKMDVNVGANYIIGKNSISNGTVDISNASSSQNIFGLAQYATPATTLTMDKVNFIGEGFNSGYAVFEIGNSGADVALTVTNSTIDLKNDNATQGGFVKGYGPNCVLTITNTEVTLDNTDMFNVNVAANITDSEFAISNLSDTVFRNLGGTIDNSVISITNSSNGIRNSSAGYNLAVTNNSSIKISGSTNTEAGKVGDLVLAEGNKVDVDTTSELLVETSFIANADDVTGNVISKADSIYVQYKKTDIDANGEDNLEGQDVYEIVLAGADAEKINELASADLTFEFVGTPVTGGAMDYFVAPAEGVSLSQLGDRYMFNYDGVTKYEESGLAIVIGTITIDGYGSYVLKTADATTNAVYATEIRNNIVDGFTPAAGLVVNADMTANDGMVGEITDGNVAVPARTLTINLDFPNAIEDNAIAYQDMKVEITGNIDGVNKTVVYNLGEDEVAMANGSYVVTEGKLVLNNAYTVTVSGAGYRTARYTVTMTEDKTLRFWNNVMDEAQFVEIGKESSKVNVTYLAGDIVKDNNINIYDLSAVVSYFGSTATVANKYAKYDLNRDGIIDSKDVAYVLVSWDK